MEINIGNEESKSGCEPEQAAELVQLIAQNCPRLAVKGLMCVAPEMESMDAVRPYFAHMRRLKDEIAALNLPGVEMKELSMGMTGDFPVAIEEGATIIRVGTAIFGKRDYAK